MCSLMETEEDTSIFIGLDRDDLRVMLDMAESGRTIALPGLDLLNLARTTQCAKMITNMQFVVTESDEAFGDFMVQIGRDLGLDVQHRGAILPGGEILDNPEGPIL